MAVVIVGDIDPLAAEELLREELGAIPPADPPREAPSVAISWREETVAGVAAQPNITTASIAVVFRRRPAVRDRSALPHERVTTSLRQSLVERVIAAILTERLEKEGFALGTVKFEEPVRGADMFTLRTSAEDGSPRVTLARLLGTVERVRQYGVTAEELARVATYYVSTYERQFAERSAQTSSTYADAYTKVFLNVVWCLRPG